MYQLFENIRLVPFDRHYLSEEYKSWFVDQEVTKYNSHGIFPKTEKDYEEFLASINKNLILAIESSGFGTHYKHVGNVSLQNIDWINRTAELAIVIGDKGQWGNGIASATCAQMLEHGFLKMNLNRIYLGTAEKNIGMRGTAMNIGMFEEGSSPEALYLEGEYSNIIRYYITKSIWIAKKGSNP